MQKENIKRPNCIKSTSLQFNKISQITLYQCNSIKLKFIYFDTYYQIGSIKNLNERVFQ